MDSGSNFVGGDVNDDYLYGFEDLIHGVQSELLIPKTRSGTPIRKENILAFDNIPSFTLVFDAWLNLIFYGTYLLDEESMQEMETMYGIKTTIIYGGTVAIQLPVGIN